MASRKRPLIAALASLLFLGCSSIPEPIPLGADTKSYGYISQGSKFGVSVGDSMLAVHTLMAAQKFDAPLTNDCGDEGALGGMFDCVAGENFEIYHRRRGELRDRVFLKIENDKVDAIGWTYGYLQADF